MIKWFALLGFLAISITVVGGSYSYWRANPPLPKEPERYKGIDLYFPQKLKPSAEMALYLQQKGDMEQRNMRNLERIREEIRSGKWPEELELLSWVQATLKDLKLFEAALRSEGCFPYEKTTSRVTQQGDSQRFRYSRFIWGVELLAYRSLLFIRRGAASEGIKHLYTVHKSMLYYEMECRPSLLVLNVIASSVQVLQDSVLFALRYAGLSPKDRDVLLEILFSWATRPPLSFSMGLRQEAYQAKKIINSFKDAIKEQMKKKQEEENEIPKEISDEFLNQTHLVDFDQTRRLINQKYRCLIKKVEQDFSPNTFRKCSVELYLERLRKQKTSYLHLLRRNIVGQRLLSQLTPAYRLFLLQWYASKCRAAALLALWYRSLTDEDKQQIPKRYLFELKNPYTHKPFGKSLAKACALPSWVSQHYPLADRLEERPRPALPAILKAVEPDKSP
ncbi:MAG: hypothetical protein H6727_04015 [Myxococcales bacterium]|nr:hypothetical protein [Myxococcales bacterium]